MELQRKFLAFMFDDPNIEKHFHHYYYKKTLSQNRFAVIFGAFIYAIFAILDYEMMGEHTITAWVIRFAIIEPYILLIIASSFMKCFEKYGQLLLGATAFVVGLSIIMMTVLAEGITSYIYGLGLFVVIIWIFILSGLNFLYSTFFSFLMIFVYDLSLLFLIKPPLPIFINNNFFLIASAVLGMFGAYIIERYMRKDFLSNLIIDKEREKSDQLLLNILPEPIANELKNNNGTIAHGFDAVSILFADIVGFTDFSEKIPPKTLVGHLNNIFSRFDNLVQRYQLEKIKTIGDAYMVAAGLPQVRKDHAHVIANLAMDMFDELDKFNIEAGIALNLRIGIHSGPAVAGVIGIKKFIYDVWGDTVNTASRMESHGVPGHIQVSENTYKLLKNDFEFEDRGLTGIKGKGKIHTYLLKGKKIQSNTYFKIETAVGS